MDVTIAFLHGRLEEDIYMKDSKHTACPIELIHGSHHVLTRALTGAYHICLAFQGIHPHG